MDGPSPAALSPLVGLEALDPSGKVAGGDGEPISAIADGLDADGVIRDLVAAHELERRRIARNLHDVVGQALTAVKLSLEHLRRDPGTRRTDAELRRSIAIVDQAMRDLRDIAFDLRPAILDDLGLVTAARWFVSRQARIVGYRSSFRADHLTRGIGVEVEAVCFRTLQEALTNVARHARASRVQVELRQTQDELILVVEDDGVGFDPRRARHQLGRHPTLGLIGASERIALVGGSLAVDSRPGEGTRIRAHFPRRGPPVDFEARR
ncbi:MAG: hypothetical protein A2V88_02205 [Elusimicrobia bacterium RBG_16_66_12]|nr:MAG: hypothetical protein A2V88_02205 [Elusimicrobia bacterium RBG_16_66_12]